MKQKMLSALLLFVLGLTGLQAQEVTATSGGKASGSGGSVSYSVGQVFYTTQTGTNGYLIQGIQQPYEILVESEAEVENIQLACSAYPNPTDDILVLYIENPDVKNLSYQLFDTKGTLLENVKVTGNQTNISMKERVPAIYFLKVSNTQKVVKSFKIIKR
jgi:hypothetical protein